METITKSRNNLKKAAIKVLEPDHELTYEILKRYGFSRSSAVEYALEIIAIRQ